MDIISQEELLNEDGDNGFLVKKIDVESGSIAAFEALERDFQEVLNELVGDKGLEKFRLEYEKLHRALKKSHEQEKRLIKKCRELNTEIVSNAAKVQTAVKLSQEDQATNANLRKEVEKAYAMMDAATEKETQAKDTINALKDEISSLSKLVEKGAGLSLGQEGMVKELVKVRDDLQHENEEKTERITIMESQMDALLKAKDEVDKALEEATHTQASMTHALSKRDAEIERELRRRDRVEKEFKELNGKLNAKLQEQVEMNKQLCVSKQQAEFLESQLNEARTMVEKYMRDYEVLYIKTQRVNEDFAQLNMRSSALLRERNDLEKENKIKHASIAKLNADLTIAEKKYDREHKQTLKYQQMAEDAKTPLIVAQGEIERLEKELDLHRRIEHKVQKGMESLEIQKKQQRKLTQKAEENTHKKEEQVLEGKRLTSSLEGDIRGLRVEVSELKKVVSRLERERSNLQGELAEQRHEYNHVTEEVKACDLKIHELQRKLAEAEAKFKHQQQLYESVRTDRNNYSKSLVEAQDEIVEVKREAKIMNHQIEQLKEEIGAKDHALVREHFDFKEVEKQREQIRAELSKMKQLVGGNEKIIKQQDVEIQRITLVLKRLDDEALLQRKEYDQVINERDILGTQLIRRNDELALLYEKLRIMQSTLEKGEAQYNNRLKDIRILRLKCMELESKVASHKNTGGSMDDMKRDMIRLKRELLQEKTKVKALSEELENPMNIHRWRKLEGSDPATYEMIQKIQTLQKRLISKTEEVIQRDQVLAEKEQLYLELKSILARQPGPEVAEQLGIYQSNLKEKTRQMKALAAELNMYHAQVNEYRYEVERLTRELQDIKKKYYEQKRRDQLAKEVMNEAGGGGPKHDNRIQSLEHQQAMNARQAVTRYAGGGFAIK